MMSELTGETVTPLIPQIPSGKPLLEEILVQVSPSSVLFHKAEPSPPLDRLQGVLLTFQVLAYKTLGLFGSIIKSTTPEMAKATVTTTLINENGDEKTKEEVFKGTLEEVEEKVKE